MSRRAQDWPKRLTEFIRSRESMPFAWGTNDCCMFCCDWVLAATGIDMAADFRGTYSNEVGAALVLSRHGGIEQIAETQTKASSFSELASPLMAQRGDIGLIDVPGGVALGVCDGRSLVSVGSSGTISVPLSKCLRAWRIE